MNSSFQLNPEHRSITAICVVEDVSKCPTGYTPVLRTYDQDVDADLWKDGFFGRRVTRYICASKSRGRPEHVLTSIQIMYDKEMPPEGYSLIQQTVDSNQKAFQKKQLCFKLGHYRSNIESIVEVIVLSKLKTAPEGFDHVGDINGMHFCVRKISALTRLNSPSLGYAMSPPGSGPMNAIYPNMQQSLKDLSMTAGGSTSGGNSYPNSAPTSPLQTYSPGSYEYNSPAHAPVPLKSTNTLGMFSDIEGIPFVLHEDLQSSFRNNMSEGSRFKPVINIKSETDIDMEYEYDFRTERDILITNGC